MQESEYQKFKGLFLQMTGCYPGAPVTASTGETYWKHLRSFPFHVIVTAMSRAASGSPNFYPSAVAIEGHAKAIWTPPPEPRPEYLSLTGDVGFQLPDDNPYEQLAQKWEKESRENGTSPDSYCSKETNKRRMGELRALGDVVEEVRDDAQKQGQRGTNGNQKRA